MRKADVEKAEAKETLLKRLQPGSVVYTLMRNRARSGMTRWYDVYTVDPSDGTMLRLTWSVAKLIGFTYDRKHEAIKVSGCGFDGGFQIVYDLGYRLFADGKLGEEGDRAGYMLNHRTL